MAILSGYHTRGYLPHLQAEGAAYFATFRLADSLPNELLASFREQRYELVRRSGTGMNADPCGTLPEIAPSDGCPFDAFLDRLAGAAWMKDRRVADIVAGSLRHFDGDRYSLCAWCVMPNHVHAVLQPLGNHALERILHTWKSFSAHEANKLIRKSCHAFWQHESYDHLIKNHRDLVPCCAYTEQNPVRAGLCLSAIQRPWSSAAVS